MTTNVGVKVIKPGAARRCPFCGGPDQMLAAIPCDGIVRFAVGCECGAVGPSTDGSSAMSQEEIDAQNSKALELWNGRAKER